MRGGSALFATSTPYNSCTTNFQEIVMAKIGLSYSRCVKDIVDGKVDIADVLVIISRTNFDPHNDKQWKGIWEGYGGGGRIGGSWNKPEWNSHSDEDEDRFRSVSIELWERGKLHQPRQFGVHPQRMPYYWLETVLLNDNLDANPAAKKAWNQFQVIAGLTNVSVDKEYL